MPRKCLTILLALLLATAFAQRVEFEVASVKPSAMQSGQYGIGFSTFPGGRVRANMVKLDYLIQIAFNLQPFQISGGPRWIHEDRFDLEAKPPATSKSAHSNPRVSKLPPNDEQRQMLQALLEDRFQLKYRRETEHGPVYFLVKTNKPLQLRPAEDPEAFPWVGSVAGGGPNGDGIAGTNASMGLLAERLSTFMDRKVIDQTGLAGAFDFKYPLPKEDPAPDLVSSIFASLQGLGLKLESGRAPIETLAIESVQKLQAN